MSPLFWQHLLTIDPSGRRFRGLIEALGTSSLEPIAALHGHPDFRETDREKLRRIDPKQLESVLKDGVAVAPFWDINESYAETDYVSPALFVRGSLDALKKPCVAIVGTRKCSPYGQACAEKFGENLALAGVTIISGGAFGIDAAAHRGALKAGGRTVAVSPTGIQQFYPSTHRQLYDDILERGAIVSQFPVGMGSRHENFLARNHTIAALSEIVIIIEAPFESGAMSTATAAGELGRELMVVPGPISSGGFTGSHYLIRNGATLVSHPKHVLDSLGLESVPQNANFASKLSEPQQQIMDVLTETPQSSEKIADLTGMDASDVMVELTMLEMEGLLFRHSAGYARKP